MNSKVVFGQYYHTSSWLHRLDPRTKMVGIFLLIISLFLLENIYWLLGAFALIMALILSSRIPFGKFLNSLKMMTTLLLITVFFQLLFNRGTNYKEFHFTLSFFNLLIIITLLVLFFLSRKIIRKHRFFLFLLVVVFSFFLQTVLTSEPVLAQYSLRFYEDGLYTSFKIVMRIVSLILISALLTLTTKPTDLNIAMEKLARPLKYIGIKVSILSMMISIALRFIPTLINEAGRILKAQASRGTDFKEGKFHEKVTQIISLLVPMFVISYRRAYDLADAMEARGYIPESERTTISLLKFRFVDYISLVLVVLILTSLIVLKVMGYAI
ncbi:MAG: energy-coupling factor transporter transmembrane protein EcfT [Acholeplasmataceae bacterium]|nr:energy-coupling factor transporter transmembrane protein EcfT [Acholeplasmataceae bacterium]